MSEQVIIAIGIENPESVSDEKVLREYNRIINVGFNKGKIIHLGKRSHSAGYMKDEITGATNIAWFKTEYPEEQWTDIVTTARKAAYEKALEQFKRRSNIRGAREEMERILSARVANSEFYGIGDEKIDELKKEQEILLEAIRRPKVSLDSAAFVWMVNQSYGQMDY